MRRLNELENKIGYHFQDFSNLEHALRHSSFCNEQKMNRLMNNERLEFLGDAVLELTSSIKSCHPELCSLVNEGKCILAGSSRFAKVNCGGAICVGMSAVIEK